MSFISARPQCVNGLASNRHHAIIWTNAGLVYWRKHASHGHNELTLLLLLLTFIMVIKMFFAAIIIIIYIMIIANTIYTSPSSRNILSNIYSFPGMSLLRTIKRKRWGDFPTENAYAALKNDRILITDCSLDSHRDYPNYFFAVGATMYLF